MSVKENTRLIDLMYGNPLNRVILRMTIIGTIFASMPIIMLTLRAYSIHQDTSQFIPILVFAIISGAIIGVCGGITVTAKIEKLIAENLFPSDIWNRRNIIAKQAVIVANIILSPLLLFLSLTITLMLDQHSGFIILFLGWIGMTILSSYYATWMYIRESDVRKQKVK